MNKYKEINAEEIESNLISEIGRKWMLITAADGDKVNTMTASWGCTGFLWNKPVAVCFIRPQRYTYSFTENSDVLTLSFFNDSYHSALSYCGAHSGRDGDKFAASGLTPVRDGEFAYPAEARMVLFCRKLYTDMIKKDNFLVPELLKNYPKDDFHKVYVCLIEKVLICED